MNFSFHSYVNRLVILLGIVFFVFQFFLLYSDTSAEIGVTTVGLPSSIEEWSSHPWSIFTHFLVHLNLGHFLLNVTILYTLGHWVEEHRGGLYFVKVFLLGVLAGVICYAISGEWNGTNDRFLVGSSAGAMSVMGALLALQPNRKVNFFGVFIISIGWLVVFVVLIDLIGIRQGWNIGGHLAHWGGLLVGFLMVKWGRNEKRNGAAYQHRRPKTDEQFNAEKLDKERRLNAILDKINRSGFDSLSKSEKDFLNQQSR
jgi:membrane associated rhomboid family serine protease